MRALNAPQETRVSEGQKFKRGDRVRHIDGSEGMVERVTVDRVTVQFPYRWRSSVVAAKNLTRIDEDES